MLLGEFLGVFFPTLFPHTKWCGGWADKYLSVIWDGMQFFHPAITHPKFHHHITHISFKDLCCGFFHLSVWRHKWISVIDCTVNGNVMHHVFKTGTLFYPQITQTALFLCLIPDAIMLQELSIIQRCIQIWTFSMNIQNLFNVTEEISVSLCRCNKIGIFISNKVLYVVEPEVIRHVYLAIR